MGITPITMNTSVHISDSVGCVAWSVMNCVSGTMMTNEWLCSKWNFHDVKNIRKIQEVKKSFPSPLITLHNFWTNHALKLKTKNWCIRGAIISWKCCPMKWWRTQHEARYRIRNSPSWHMSSVGSVWKKNNMEYKLGMTFDRLETHAGKLNNSKENGLYSSILQFGRPKQIALRKQ